MQFVVIYALHSDPKFLEMGLYIREKIERHFFPFIFAILGGAAQSQGDERKSS